jgi:hypothetical protein
MNYLKHFDLWEYLAIYKTAVSVENHFCCCYTHMHHAESGPEPPHFPGAAKKNNTQFFEIWLYCERVHVNQSDRMARPVKFSGLGSGTESNGVC